MPADSLTGLDKAAVARRFNRSAATYDAFCRVQRRMADRLAAGLENLPDPPHRILELGCGTGYLTGLLAQRYPGAQIVALDLAERMVDVARRRNSSTRIEFRIADAEASELEHNRYDLIASNATVQWFEEPDQSLPRLAAALRPGGRMIHSTFGPATFVELRRVLDESWDQAAGDPVPAGLPLRPGKDWTAILRSGGLAGVVSTRCIEVEHYATAADFLRELQATGVTYRPGGPAGHGLAPRALMGALGRYETRYRSTAGVPVTYELLRFTGVQPA